MPTDVQFSREGHQWTPRNGLQQGLPSISVIQPRSNRKPDHISDVVVVGAGYAGLTAVRDLSIAGHNVLLLEGRDRIGGRTWSSTIQGYPYELGGTWIHWNQPFVWRELARYGMTRDLETSPATGRGLEQSWINYPNGTIKVSLQEEFAILESALNKFINVDGNLGRDVIPFPHNPHQNPIIAIYDKMSFADRVEQIESTLTPVELHMLEVFLCVTSGGTMENSSFFDMLRWWALNNYDMKQYNEMCLTYKLKDGQSALARRIFEDAISTGRVTYQFDTPIAEVEDCGTHVLVTSRSGQRYQAKRAIVTIPLNVLKTIKFTPALLPGKQAAAEVGHVNQCTKVHVEVANPDLRSFSGWQKGALGMSFGDGTTPAGNTHVVAFGCSHAGVRLEATADGGQKALEAMRSFAPDHFNDVRRLVFHDWSSDEFSRGTWAFFPPNMATEHLQTLRQSQGNVVFASADWARGWRGFIDGAIEDGGRAAKELVDDLRGARRLGLNRPVKL